MPRLLDPDLRRVAQLRQVSIKTARDWRDSDNRKWHDAVSEVCSKTAIEVEASPVPFGHLSKTASKASTATLSEIPDPFEGVEIPDPWDGKDPFGGFGLDELNPPAI